MRRLLRWTFNALAAASLLLCLATAALWVRSYWVCDRLYARHPDSSDRFMTWSDRGRLIGYFEWSEPPHGHPIRGWEFEVGTTDPAFEQLVMEFGLVVGNRVAHVRRWRLPDWPIVSAFAVLPAVAVFRQLRAVRRRRRRARLGLCPACGYVCRATPERCPECGRKA